ncbi:hypothetical protein BY458DRAFT_497756 [Sporodiniella umbellata]|nr:hypothetical protein BY458DRAFT_497756 [Sporodiniella umbellata]
MLFSLKIIKKFVRKESIINTLNILLSPGAPSLLTLHFIYLYQNLETREIQYSYLQVENAYVFCSLHIVTVNYYLLGMND